MVIKVYVSGISASKEVKKRQQRALLLLDSVQVEYEPIDITEPGREDERTIVQQTFKSRKDKVTPLPPQFFNDDHYCGDYEDFNCAVDVDQLFAFLKLEERKQQELPLPLMTTPILPDLTSSNEIEEKQQQLNDDVQLDANIINTIEEDEIQEKKEKGEVDQNEVENELHIDKSEEIKVETKVESDEEVTNEEEEEEEHIEKKIDHEETSKRLNSSEDEEEDD